MSGSKRASFAQPELERALGLSHVVTGLWLMYLTFGTVLNIASGYSLPAG